MDYEVIPPQLAVKAMRDSGYRDSAHAIAELVDNSIQAGAGNVEILCRDKLELVQNRTRRRIDQIAVYDDGSGMAASTLRIALQFGNGTHLEPEEQMGIGKFGMGLPNSSISQCERVDVWSWQNKKCVHTYLDIQEILAGTMRSVPEPKRAQFPAEWKTLIKSRLGDSGTLVVWTRLDRVRWKGSKALLDNSSFLIGRMYRYFIGKQKVKIRLAAFSPEVSGAWEAVYDETVEPNDPLYLMSNTSCPTLPAPYERDSMFEEWGDPNSIAAALPNGEKHSVTIRFTIVKNQVRKRLAEISPNPGRTMPGKHAQKNIGISLVRADRELEMSREFVIGYDPTERWWGIEVSFPPALDDLFGVTNNKQAATAFEQLDLDADAEAEGVTPQEYREALEAENDPRLLMYEMSKRIQANLRAIRKQLGRVREGARRREISEPDPAELAATKATRTRQQEGFQGLSDREEERAPEERAEELASAIVEQGADPKEAKEIALEHVRSGIKYVFQEASYDGPSFFSVASRGGTIIVNVNTQHPATKYLYELLETEESDPTTTALEALKLLLCAWARMEDESQGDRQRARLSDMRNDWGRITRDFLHAAHDED
jgi:hypothetical protein